MARLRIAPGTWFAVPLDGGGYGSGVAARVQASAALGYFFGPREDAPAAQDALEPMRPSDAVLVGRFSLAGLRAGDWPVIGRTAGWSERDWPMPRFVRYDLLAKRYLAVHYEGDLFQPAWEGPLSAGDSPEAYLQDGLMGDGYVAQRLSRLLDEETFKSSHRH